MAYILKKIGNTANVPCRTFECDNESDLSSIDVSAAPMGSRCYVINTGKVYALNSDKVWKLVPNSSSSDQNYDGGDEGSGNTGPEGSDVIYDGGEEV